VSAAILRRLADACLRFPGLLEAGTLVWLGRQQRFPTENPRALRLKKSAQFVCKKCGTVRSRIKFQQKTPLGFEKSCSDIVDKKFPIAGCPFEPFSVVSTREPVKTNAVAGYQIEFSSEIGQRRLWLNAPDHAANVEELDCAAEERLLIRVQPKSLVTK